MYGWIKNLLGNQGEKYAAKYLKKQGYQILSRQYRNRFGEIDLIAVDGNVLVFIEVKTRRSDYQGKPEEAVTPKKQGQIRRVALSYMKKKNLEGTPFRFDVVSLLWPESSKIPELKHIKNAF